MTERGEIPSPLSARDLDVTRLNQPIDKLFCLWYNMSVRKRGNKYGYSNYHSCVAFG
jgi:hypothetical protein